MTLPLSQFLRSGTPALEVSEALRLPVTKMLGVSAEAGSALGRLGIATIFDLGAASIFATARAAASAAGATEVAGRHGVAPGDWLKPGTEYVALDAIGQLPLAALRGLTDEEAADLGQALDVATIAEFANWGPQRTARELLGNTVGSALSLDELQTEALRPRFGEYPTERVFYTSLVMLDSGRADGPLADLAGPLSLADAMGASTGFDRPAVGALVTFSQSWYAQGVTLGHTLHSLALAPGEATRIAVIDFSRRTSAQASESVGEFESLSSQTGHQRAISEVQSAVASEMQSGGRPVTSNHPRIPGGSGWAIAR